MRRDGAGLRPRQSPTGFIPIDDNVIGGNLTCVRNSPDVTDDGKPNMVTGGTTNPEFFVLD